MSLTQERIAKLLTSEEQERIAELNRRQREHRLAWEKQYREKNKERLKAKYEERKDEINARRRENPKRKEYSKMYSSLKATCSCGLELLKQNLPRHMRSKQHNKEAEKVRQFLEEKTNTDIANNILSFIKESL